jgi:hypothetical protein
MGMPKKKPKIQADATIASTGSKEPDDWEARHAFDTLIRAHEITSNTTLMKRVKQHAKQHKERADRVARLEGKLL